MVKSLTKVIYKPDSQSTDEYIAIVNIAEYTKWKAGDTSIPLTEVVDAFKVFHSGQGAQGILGSPSQQQLDTVFNTHNEVEVITIVLQKGVAQPSDPIHSAGVSGTMNATRGSAAISTKSKGNTGI